MHEIIPNQLWIGNAGDGRDCEQMLAAGVAAVVNLAREEPTPVLPRDLIYCRIPIDDGEQEDARALDLAIQTVVTLLRSKTATLVHCGAGMSRAPAVAAAALATVEGGSPDEKLKQIATRRPHDVSPQLWEAVKKAFRNIHEL